MIKIKLRAELVLISSFSGSFYHLMIFSSPSGHSSKKISIYFWSNLYDIMHAYGTGYIGSLYRGINNENPPLRSEPPDFCPGFQCFQISVFESSRRDFIDSQISKILSRDFIVS